MNGWHLDRAVRMLRRGGIVLHATEGVWGFACDPFDAAAVSGIIGYKGRGAAKGFILIGAGEAMFQAELEPLSEARRRAVSESWPGAVTWLLPSRRFPAWVTGGRPAVAVRVPAHAQARRLCEAFGGPLVSTSANPSGRPPARNGLQARRLFEALRRRRERPGGSGLPPIFLLPGETAGRRGPSEIRTLEGLRVR